LTYWEIIFYLIKIETKTGMPKTVDRVGNHNYENRLFMRKKMTFKVIANRNIGGKSETERYEEGILTKIVAGKGKRINRIKLHQGSNGGFVRMIDDKIQNREFEISNLFNDVSWLDILPKERKEKERTAYKNIAVTIVKIQSRKVIDKGESVIISSESSPSAAIISEAFREQLGKTPKGSLSTDFFTIERI
jgi:hypothetical protein